jgi:hypothetical protein
MRGKGGFMGAKMRIFGKPEDEILRGGKVGLNGIFELFWTLGESGLIYNKNYLSIV